MERSSDQAIKDDFHRSRKIDRARKLLQATHMWLPFDSGNHSSHGPTSPLATSMTRVPPQVVVLTHPAKHMVCKTRVHAATIQTGVTKKNRHPRATNPRIFGTPIPIFLGLLDPIRDLRPENWNPRERTTVYQECSVGMLHGTRNVRRNASRYQECSQECFSGEMR